MFKKLIPHKDWIIYDDNDIMKQKSAEIILPLTDNDNEIISKMISYIDASYNGEDIQYDIKPGIGIAAIQLGYPKQIIYIHFKENDIEFKYLLANPKIILESYNKSYLAKGEGCLSVRKSHKGISIRKSHIIVEAWDLLTNQNIKIKAKNLLSICLQHEIDHLNGIFYYNKINRSDPFYNEKEWNEIL